VRADQVLEVLAARIAEAVHTLPLSSADPFGFEPDALDRALRAAPVDHRRVIVDSDGNLLRWMKDCLAYIENTEVPHKESWLRQEHQQQKHLVKFLDDLNSEAARLIACLSKAYSTRKCPFPGGAAKAMDYFCLVRVGLVVMQRANQLPVEHELLSRYANTFRSLLEQLPRDADVYNAYLKWIARGDPLRIATLLREDWAANDALCRIGIDDRTFTAFVQEAKLKIPRILLRIKENGT
jgi:hypothetical protein